jgi:hypothetical protein
MWPAGPYSVVNTASGVLTTTIPLFSLSGPGGTSIDFASNRNSRTCCSRCGNTQSVTMARCRDSTPGAPQGLLPMR